MCEALDVIRVFDKNGIYLDSTFHPVTLYKVETEGFIDFNNPWKTTVDE